ncbi:unnamed protein product [Effrenium voratum]|uniref:Uncharacterized protein n=1 Tax=Effrenium voratum TaxID=2562239 RepID=A0AA36JME2_9DINO|nr:unnamed protein product [Effrenium voratum]
MEMHAASPLGGLEDYLHGLLRALPHTLACIDDFYYEEDIDADQGQLWRERSEAQAPDQTESKAPDESHVDESPHAAPAAHGALPGELAAMPIDAPDQSQVVESPRAPGRQLDELAAELVPVEAPDQSHVVESPRAPGKQLDELAAELVPVEAPDQSHVVESPRAPGRQLDELAAELLLVDAPDQSHAVESPRAPGTQLDELAAELLLVDAADQSHVVESPRAPGRQLDELAAELVPVEAVTAACHAVRSAALRYHKSPQKLPSGQVDKSDSASRACRLTGRAAPERLWEKPWPSGRANLHEPRVDVPHWLRRCCHWAGGAQANRSKVAGQSGLRAPGLGSSPGLPGMRARADDGDATCICTALPGSRSSRLRWPKISFDKQMPRSLRKTAASTAECPRGPGRFDHPWLLPSAQGLRRLRLDVPELQRSSACRHVSTNPGFLST